MEHQDGHIPDEIAEEWQAVEVELWQASRVLEEANRRYQAAIIARIALSQRIQN